MKNQDIVFQICQSMLDNSPEASLKRLNPALHSTLQNCIEADLPFQPDTFERIYNKLRGSWWFGDGAGNHKGEGFYNIACAVNHASAQQSFENWAKRPGVFWEEDAKSPVRLCCRSQFTWQGHYVTVTSMRQDSLVACTYKDYAPSVEGLKPGAILEYDKWLITAVKSDGDTTVVRVVKAPKGSHTRQIAKRFTITYAEIAEYRKTCKARLKAMLDKIAKCDPTKDADALTKEVNAAHFRHYELEEVRAAFNKRRAWHADTHKVELWRAGKGSEFLDVKENIVRVRDGRVECSNGNSVSAAAVRALLPVVLDHRREVVALDLPLDSYRIQRISAAGVKIGCTLIAWSEVDYLKGIIP